MSISFEQGVKYVADNMGAAIGGQLTNQWINGIDEQVEHLIDEMSNEVSKRPNLDTNRLQGFVFEKWHSETFNLSSAVHRSASHADTLGSNKLASVDVNLKSANGQSTNYSMKSYQSSSKSLHAQSKALDDTSKSAYFHQQKLIPKEQLDEAKKLSKLMIDKATKDGDLDKAARFEEVRKTLTDKISDSQGSESIPINRTDIEELTKELREGKVDKELLKEYGVDVSKLITAKDIMGQAFSAGLSAAVISLVIGIAPTIANGISMLITKGEIDPDIYAELGHKSLSSSAKGFLNGSITAALYACCQTGRLGETLIGVDNSMVSSAVVLMMGTLDLSIKFAAGKISKAQMADEIAQLHITTAFSVGGGMLMTALLPQLSVFSYMLGSFIGGMIGGFVYNISKNLFMSFCVESGCTFFGLVDQNYELPQEILDEIGIEVFDYEKFEYDTFEYDSFQFDRFVPDQFEYDKFGITILRRGVIGVSKIGYV